ncbi:MAG: hypothetical protein WA064_04885 [Candidatus Moraniibacteriota bacterium]
MKKIFKKIFLTLFVVINIFSLSVPSASAGIESFLLGNPVGIKDEIMNSLGVNQAELKNTISTMNVMRQKVTPPQLMLSFSPANPVPGEKVTVTATPTYFLNPTESQYFTWYLKNKKCTDKESDKDKYSYVSDCDLDTNQIIDIEDYKIKAGRIIAGNDFVWDTPSTLYTSDSDHDGYEASSGGDDQKGKEPHCFFHDVASGNDYELSGCDDNNISSRHLFPKANGEKTGDGSFGASEESFWHTNPNSDDTAGTGNVDEANVAGMGMQSFTFTYSTGDKVGVVVEGIATQPTTEPDASYKTMWAFSNNTCDADKLNADPTGDDYPKSASVGPTSTTLPSSCTVPAGNTCTATNTVETEASIVDGTRINDLVTIRTLTTTTTNITCVDQITGAPTTPAPCTTPIITQTTTCPASYSEGDQPRTLGATEAGPNNGITCSGADEDNQSALDSDSIPTVKSLNKCLYDNLVTPSEGGGANQKMDVAITYGPQNPLNDASDLGNGDQLSFKGTVTGAQNPDYLNYEWQVFSGDAPDTDNWTQIAKADLPDATQTIGLGIDSFKFKLNFTKNVPKYLKVKLIAKDSISDTETKEGHTDVVIPISSASERIKIYPTIASFNANGESLISVSADAKELCLFKLTPEDSSTTPDAICEVTKNEILAVKVDTTAYNDFLWTFDGKTLTCPSSNFQNCLSADAAPTQTNTSYFPVLKEIDEEFTINLSAVDKSSGKQLSLSRAFKVVNPSVKITPVEHADSTDANKYTCRGNLLGQYIDLDGRAWDDRSTTEFQALTGSEIKLTPVFTGANLSQETDRKKFQWIVDGNTISETNVTEYGGYGIKDGTLTLPPKAYSETYSIEFSTLYTQDSDKKQALNSYWNVGYNDFYEKKLSHSIKIKMASVELAKAQAGKKAILATISAGIPTYIAFLFRLVLAGFVIIFATKIIFFILPKAKNYYNEY